MPAVGGLCADDDQNFGCDDWMLSDVDEDGWDDRLGLAEEDCQAEEDDGEEDADGEKDEGSEDWRLAKKARMEKGNEIQSLAAQFLNKLRQPAPRETDSKRKRATLVAAHLKKRGSLKKQGTRKNDVKLETLKKRPSEYPGNGFIVSAGQLFCSGCHKNIGSSKQAARQHINTEEHKTGLKKTKARDKNRDKIMAAITDFEKEVAEENDGVRVAGLVDVPKETQTFRAEVLEEFLKAGIAAQKTDRLRNFLQRRCGMTLVAADKLLSTYLQPLRIKEKKTFREEVDGQDVGIANDGTTHCGESHAWTARWCTEDIDLHTRVGGVRWFRGSMNNEEISATMITAPVQYGGIPLINILDLPYDSAAPNLLSYESTLTKVMPYADGEQCCPHTGNHTGEKMNTPTMDKFLKEYCTCVGHSELAKTLYHEATGDSLLKGGSIRWWADNDIVVKSIYPHLFNGKLIEWCEAMVERDLCEKTAPRMLKMLKNPTTLTLLRLDGCISSFPATEVQANFTEMEGQTIEYLTGYKNLKAMEGILNDPISAAMRKEIEKIASLAPKSDSTAPAISQEIIQHTDARARALLNNPIAGVRVSILPNFWNWPGEVPPDRCCGTIKQWTQKTARTLNIHWDDNLRGKTEEMEDQKDDATFLLQDGLDFRIDSGPDGQDAPVAPSQLPDTFLLANSNLSHVEVLMARVRAAIGPAAKYFRDNFVVKRAGQMERMRVAQMFDPRHVQETAAITVEDVLALSCFRFSKRADLAMHIKEMESEVQTYNKLIALIKPKSERMVERVTGDKTVKVDPFDVLKWWKMNRHKLPSFARVLRAVLTHIPNSCAPEAVFSILNDTFTEDQKKAKGDYMELALLLQYNARGREKF